MKKTIKATLLALLIGICTCLLSSCGIVLLLSVYEVNLGTYKLTTIVDQDGVTIAEAKNRGPLVSESMIVQLKIDGTATISWDENFAGGPARKDFHWVVKSWNELDTLIFSEGENSLEVICTGGTLDIEFGEHGERVILKKNIAIHIDEIASDIGDYIGKKEEVN